MRGSLVPGSSSLSVVSPRRFAAGDRGGFRVFCCRAGPPRNGMCDVASSCGTSTRPRRDAGLSRCVNIKSHVKYDAGCRSPLASCAASRMPAGPVTRARPAGSCAVPPRVACAAAAASTAAVGPGVVTGPARRDSTHRDAAHAACRPVPLRGRASPERRPGRDGRRGDRFRVLYAYPERTTGRSAYPTRNRKRPIRARPDEPNPARDRRDGKYDTRSNPNITLPPRLPETTSGRARYPRTHLAVTPLTRAGRAADGRRAPRRCAGRVGV